MCALNLKAVPHEVLLRAAHDEKLADVHLVPVALHHKVLVGGAGGGGRRVEVVEEDAGGDDEVEEDQVQADGAKVELLPAESRR